MSAAQKSAVPSHRQRRVAFLSMAAVPLICIALAAPAGLRINMTASMPRGLWRVSPVRSPIARGAVISLCPPDSAVFRRAMHRGYITSGGCPGGYEPLLKPVAAISGDVVSVTAAGIAVNGILVANTAALAQDSAGRMLQPLPLGVYRVSPGDVWVLSGHDSRSFDSRYFGAVPAAKIAGVARPLWVIR
jgi:conjugative transfer signal peptidase TraF